MIIKINVHADSERIRIEVPQAEMWVDISNSVAYHLASSKIVAIGETPGDMLSEHPSEWENLRSEIGFVHPFDVDCFESQYAVNVLIYYAYMARVNLRSRFPARLGFFDRFDYQLDIDRYDNLPPASRQDFECRLLNSMRVHSVSLNGTIVDRQSDFIKAEHMKRRQRMIMDWTFRLVGVFWLAALVALVLTLLPKDYWNTPVEKASELIGVIVILTLLVFAALFLSTLSYILLARLFVPLSTLRAFIRTTRPLPRRAVTYLIDTLLGEELGT